MTTMKEALLSLVPAGRMRAALAEQRTPFVRWCVKAWLRADRPTRADIRAFFDSDGPEKVRRAHERLARA
jgi:hypothetical protein